LGIWIPTPLGIQIPYNFCIVPHRLGIQIPTPWGSRSPPLGDLDPHPPFVFFLR
jgi:hypothetical protein